MKPLNDKWIKRYRQQDKDKGINWENNWLGAWHLMRDFQNAAVVIKTSTHNLVVVK